MENFIYYTIIYITEAIILWLYTRRMFSPRHQIFPEAFSLTVCYAALLGLNMLQISWLNLVAFFIVNFLFILFSYRVSLPSALFHTTVVTVAMTVGELIAVNCLFHIAYNFYSQQYSARNMIISAIFNKLIYFFILQLIVHINARQKKSSEHFDSGIILLVISALVSIFFLMTLVILCENIDYSRTMDRMVTASVILILIWNLLVFGFYSFSLKRNEEFTSLQLQLQREESYEQYQKQLMQEDQNQKILIHDMRNHLQTISILNKKGDAEKIDEYIAEIIHSPALQTTAKISNHYLLNNILNRYIRQCRKKKIDFRADIRKHSVSFLSDKDITSLFCNLLDNALEASTDLPDAFIDLSVVYKEDLSMTIVTLINSCDHNPFSEHKGALLTSKSNPEKHGFGLKSIRHVAESYNGNINLYYEEESKTFHSVLTLYKN